MAMATTQSITSTPNNTSYKSQKARNTSSSAATTASTLMSGGGQGKEFVQLNAIGLKWTEDGKRLVVLGKDRFCSCDITFKEDEDGSLDIILNEEGELNRSGGDN